MAYYLQFDGVNDRVDVPTRTYGVGDVIRISIVGYTGDGEPRYLTDGVDSNPFQRSYIIARSDNTIQFNTNVFSSVDIDGVSATTLVTSFPTDGLNHTITGYFKGIISRLGRIGSRYNNTNSWNAGILSVSVHNSSEELISNWDASASLGEGDVLPNTAGYPDGTLVNFPTDDSQWVYYGEGGFNPIWASFANQLIQ